MSDVALIILSSWLAGVAGFAGGLFAHLEGSARTPAKRAIVHGVMAFGGGTLLAAVAFSLAPESMAALDPLTLALTFSLGGIAFCLLDARLSRRGGSRAQFMAMMMDFVPEAIALGALFTEDRRGALLLAGFIGLQNLPEGFNSFREFVDNKVPARRTLLALLAASLFGPAAACTGYFLLDDLPALTAGIMSFAAGGIVYVVFRDIAPRSTMRRHWAPTLGSVLGFLLGMMGTQLLG